MLSFLIVLVVAIVAYTNGANANFKGVASLYGSGTTEYRTAVNWAAVTTAAGAVCAMFWTGHMLKAFSGKGLVADVLVADPVFLLSVAIGAALTGSLATWLGFPVSTTHALTGALVGAGLIASPGGVNFSHLWSTFALPLLFGPVVAILLGSVLYLFLRPLKLAPDHRTRTLDALHFLSAGAVCFARGLNDTPKMAALLAGIAFWNDLTGLLLVAIAMALGGLISARRVANTLANKITGMNPGQGFVANLTTSMLAITGSVYGLPLSTTHVTVGSLLGIGIVTRQARWRTAVPVLLAWVTTLPCAALLAALAYVLCRAAF
ncbi:PiT family inorganic phosphate transporter [Prosthecobacter fusiformis]|uniref:PiT family inorganic phosphate transporter n=1 Tax=Prosthecobacter fusiformis TaxID=48464 RepID=A0A4R7RUM5_9BACT|nr:inorganic phosphate transporter [Prosthecobacter fusiformis]TDU69371.1 PiT family inorganic phosphate transporter [Prosthecobacter fusiformis]